MHKYFNYVDSKKIKFFDFNISSFVLTKLHISSSLLFNDNQNRVTINNINPNILKVEYAVRGPIVARASELKNQLDKGNKLPFKEIVSANIGDCHAVGQQPITFLRQMMAAIVFPDLIKSHHFPSDVNEKAKRILSACGGNSIGAYSESTGIRIIREDVAEFIRRRDGLDADPDKIFLSTGASSGIKSLLQLLASTRDGKERSGVMVPIPQYPLYSATNAEYNMCQINYYLDEQRSWGLNEQELERALQAASSQCVPRALVVINPGNPTGQVLSREDMQAVLRFVHRNHLVLLADEVYQQNVYSDHKPFLSFKKVLHESSADLASQVQLASFFSVSKGFMGECGFRGGFCELTNWDEQVQHQLFKALSASLCSSTVGQAMMDAVVNCPQHGDPSFPQFQRERDQVLKDLRTKADLVTQSFNSIDGFSCNQLEGAMYAFPQIRLPNRAIQAAQKCNQEPDFFYCWKLLEKTGICVVPGSGFGQRAGTFHFRTTILPPVSKIEALVDKIRDFHEDFLEEYS